MLDAQFRRWAAKRKNFTYGPALSEPAPDDNWTGATGFVNVVLDKHFPGALKAKGVPETQVRHDPIKVAP